MITGKCTKSRTIAGITARCHSTFRYVSKSIAASRGFYCDSTAFVLKIGKMAVLNNTSIYCLQIHYMTLIICAIIISVVHRPFKMLNLYRL